MFQVGKHGLLSSANASIQVGGNLVVPSQKTAFHNDGYIIGIHGQNTSYNNYAQGIDTDSSGNIFIWSNSSPNQEVIKFTPTGIVWSRGLSGFSISTMKYEPSSDEVFVVGTDDTTTDTSIVRLSGSTGAIVSQYKYRHGASGNYGYQIETNSTNYVKAFSGYNNNTATYFSGVGVYSHSHSIVWENYQQDPVSGNTSYPQSAIFDGTNVIWACTKTSGTPTIDIIKVNSSGTRQWYLSILNGYHSTGQRLCVDSSSNVYMANYISDATTNANKGFMVVKTNSSGTVQWKVKYDNGNSSQPWYPRSMVIDSSNNLYVVGYTTNTGTNAANIAKSYRYSTGGTHTFVAKINSSDGSLMWTRYIATASESNVGGTKSKITSTHLWITGYAFTNPWVVAIPLDGKVSRTDKTVLTHPLTGREYSLYIGEESLTASTSTTSTSSTAAVQTASTPSASASTPTYTNNSQTTGSINRVVRI